MLSSGAIYRGSSARMDYLLLELRQPAPAGTYFSGMDASPLGATAVYAVHHPDGDVKKTSRGRSTGIETIAINTSTQLAVFNRVNWTLGVTEGGSSGSPLYTFTDTTPLFRGTLWGGLSSCSNPRGTDYFTALENYRFEIAEALKDSTPDVFELRGRKTLLPGEQIELERFVIAGMGAGNHYGNVQGGSVSVNCAEPPVTGVFVARTNMLLCVFHAAAVTGDTSKTTTVQIGTRTASFTSTTCGDTGGPDADADGIPDCVESLIGTNPGVADNRVLDDGRLFVRQAYRDWLTREPNASEQVAALERGDLIASLINGSEFQTTALPVLRLYSAAYTRDADKPGASFWISELRSKRRTLKQIAEAFAASTELVNRYGTLSNSAYVRQLYLNVLGREPDAAGAAFWVNEIGNGKVSRGGMLEQFSESAEFKARVKDRMLAASYFYFILDRQPDEAGLLWMTGEIAAKRQTLAQLANIFLATGEYRLRFYRQPNK
jgi:hypothetical protein